MARRSGFELLTAVNLFAPAYPQLGISTNALAAFDLRKAQICAVQVCNELRLLLTPCADPAPLAQNHRMAEQVNTDTEAIEPVHVASRFDATKMDGECLIDHQAILRGQLQAVQRRFGINHTLPIHASDGWRNLSKATPVLLKRASNRQPGRRDIAEAHPEHRRQDWTTAAPGTCRPGRRRARIYAD